MRELCVHMQKTGMTSNHVYMLVQQHVCLCIRSIYHEKILFMTSGALSFIIYTCKNILSEMVTDILGHPRHTAQLAYSYLQPHLYNLCTTFFHFRLLCEWCLQASVSQDIKTAIVHSQLVATQLTYSYSYKIVIITVHTYINDLNENNIIRI